MPAAIQAKGLDARRAGKSCTVDGGVRSANVVGVQDEDLLQVRCTTAGSLRGRLRSQARKKVMFKLSILDITQESLRGETKGCPIAYL